MSEHIKQFFKNSQNRYLLLLIFVFLFAIVLTNPLGEMALNDDWFYYDALKSFGIRNFQLDPWITPSLMGQIFYAKIFILIFGFSFAGVRLLTLGLALVSGCYFMKLLKKMGLGDATAFLLSLLWLFNPIFYSLSFTFMTDVPALSFVIIGFYFYFKGWSQKKDKYFFFAHFFIIYASLIRQNYILILFVFIVVFFVTERRTKEHRDFFRFIKIAISPTIIFFGIYFLFKNLGWWPSNTFVSHSFEDTKQLFSHANKEIFSVWQYLSLFLSPVLIGWIFQSSKRDKFIAILASVISVCIVIIRYVVTQELFPYSGNILSIYGLGVRDPNGVLTGIPNVVINHFWVITITLVAGILSGILLVVLFRTMEKIKKQTENGFFWFVGLNFFVQLAIILSLVSFDRYYLILEFFLLVFLVPIFGNKRTHISFILTIFIMLFSVAGTFNYLSENRLKWSMAESLLEKGIKPNSLDAGYEWLGIHWYHSRDIHILPFYSPDRPWYTTKIFPDNTRQYIISYDLEKSNYILLEKKAYNTFFGGEEFLYLLKYQPIFSTSSK